MATKPSIPKGTRDFSPVEMLRRKHIFGTIEKVFRKYGFLPLETPAMENLETLTGKYGEEGDRLIFKILNSGDWTAGLTRDEVIAEIQEAIENQVGEEKDIELSEAVAKFLRTSIRTYLKTRDVSEKALRYDLTVPFARYVVMNQHELAFPFKRYQIQPVWRADRPQKGRYREFYQCDADVIGSTSLLNEVDLMSLMIDVFDSLDLRVTIKVNSRKILAGMAEVIGASDKLVDFTIVLDKLEKIGEEKFIQEARERGITDDSIHSLAALNRILVKFQDKPASVKLDEMGELLKGSAIGLEGVQELRTIFSNSWPGLGIQYHQLEFDHTLARGLDYYTGAIIEVKAQDGTLQSSICGGGRYDDLTGIFGLKNMSGVGISFGADRIYDVLLETNKFPAELGGSTKLLFANFGEAEALHCLELLRQARAAGIAAELYPDAVKMAKQFKYADDKGIPFVAIIGENELKQGIVTIKDMKTGEQKAVKQEDLIQTIQA